MSLADEYGIPVRMLQRMISAPDAVELFNYRRTNPHWSTKILDQLVFLCYVVAKSNGADGVSMDDFRIEYERIKAMTDGQMERIGEALAAQYGSNTNG